jgi:hypothetical protein
MTRTLVVLLSALAACDVGTVLTSPHNNGPDAHQMGGGDGPVSNVCNLTPNGDDGHHNAGQACVVAGCHLAASPGAGATPWMYAGTLYKTDKVTPVVGAEIVIKVGATTVTATTGANGNFHIATQPPPAVLLNQSPNVQATGGAPCTSSMTGQLTAPGGGNCNNCHTAGGTAGSVITLVGTP